MLKAILHPFYEMVDEARQKVGDNAPKIVDAIMFKAFPNTATHAELEGCDRMFRVGMIEAVKDYLRKLPVAERQRQFSEIHDSFAKVAERLKSDSYFVPGPNGEGEYVLVKDLIASLKLLDAARKFMRQKGQECLGEADTLDELYEAVEGAE